MSARGFCTCKRDAPGKPHLHPPANATWHYLCDRPVLAPPGPYAIMPTGTGWPDDEHSSDGSFRYPPRCEADRRAAVARVIARGSTPEARDEAEGDFGPGAPFADPDDAEAERIAEVYADAAAELNRIEAEDAR